MCGFTDVIKDKKTDEYRCTICNRTFGKDWIKFIDPDDVKILQKQTEKHYGETTRT